MRTVEFFIDSSFLSESEEEKFCKALEGLAEGDIPLLFEFLLVDEERIRSLNREQRGIDKVTDVLSFPAIELVPGEPIIADEHGECVETIFEDGKETERLYLGSVVVCEERAREQAKEYQHSFARELFYLATHGVLHCLGYDHETEEERALMREKEETVMKKMNLARES